MSRIRDREPSRLSFERAGVLGLGLVGIIGLMVIVALFTGTATASRVAENAERLHWSNAMLGSAEISRLSVGQAVLVFAQANAGLSDEADQAAALREARRSLSDARLWEGDPRAPAASAAAASEVLGAADEVLVALQAGDIDRAAEQQRTRLEPAYGVLSELVVADQGLAAQRIRQTSTTAGHVGTLLQFLIVLTLPALALILYRRKTKRDVAKRRADMRARLEAEQARGEAKDDALLSAATKLEVPLSELEAGTALLAHDPTLAPSHRTGLVALSHAAAEAVRVVEDLSIAGKLDHRLMTYRPRDCSVDEVVSPLVERLRESGRDVRYEPGPVWVRVDVECTAHILRNLLSNALTHGGPDIAVECTLVHGTAVIRVGDNGRGFNKEAVDGFHLRPVGDGILAAAKGRGLPVAQELARGMSGDLTHERTPDGWTWLELRLPAAYPGLVTSDKDAGAALSGADR